MTQLNVPNHFFIDRTSKVHRFDNVLNSAEQGRKALSPQNYLVTRRMDNAHHLLETTNWTVATIAHSLGFSSAPSFARIFKNVYGVASADLRLALCAKK